MSKAKLIAKAIIGGLVAGLGAALTALNVGDVNVAEVFIGAVAVALTTFSGVYFVPNAVVTPPQLEE